MITSPRFFLTQQQWQILKAGARREIWQNGGCNGPLGVMLRMMEDADKHKRFIIEVENPEPNGANK